jgi:CheY-like chemotaxis protein
MMQFPRQSDVLRPVLRVLVVDDQADTADTWALLLRMLGHEVAVALDGLEALVVADAHDPQVVLCDIAMPKLDGYGVARKLQEKGPAKPYLVAVTARCSEEDRNRCLEAGFDRHLAKPAEPAEVEHILREVASRLTATDSAAGQCHG